MLTEFSAAFLVSPKSEPLIREASSLASDAVDGLRAITRLRSLASPEFAAAAWDLALLRRRAAAKLGSESAFLYFDRDGYEMASSAACSAYHAAALRRAGAEHVFDPCAGIGIDACRMAREGIRVTACERDPARAIYARANAAALGVAHRVEIVAADATTVPVPSDAGFAFFDPARRDDQRKRIVTAGDLVPPLSFLDRLKAGGVHSVLAKLSPAIERDLGADYGGEIEFISDAGECKEALLRTGDLRTGDAVSARLLVSGSRIAAPAPSAPVREEAFGYLYEPDPAVIRAGLTGHVVAAVDGWLLDPHIAYVFSDRYAPTPLASAYKIECGFPYHLKRLRQELLARNASQVIVKRRGFPEEPDAVRKQLKLKGAGEVRIVVLTRCGDRLWAMIVQRAG
ncbi:MAG: class I SAM-dependent methyltransferase [Capsulimonadaceae bacterium]|nr:class I SAM-dependent methyltransferase [Capsulimonadaceae bacterium]